MDLDEVNKLWYDSKPIDGINFGLNDYIRIIDGEHKGNNASVICITSLEPVKYLVEMDLFSGGDVIIHQSEIESAE